MPRHATSWHLFLKFLPLLTFLLLAPSCNKSSDEAFDLGNYSPLFLDGTISGPSIINLSYEAVISRTTSFQNGVSTSSPGWKKLEAVPETETYSFQLNVDNNDYYMLKDNIAVQSLTYDKVPPEEKITKIEVMDGSSKTYNYLDNLISTVHLGDLASELLQEVQGITLPAPVKLDSLNAQGVVYFVNGTTVSIVTLVSNGDGANTSTLLDLNSGLPYLMMSYDDNDLSKLRMMISYTYDGSDNPSTTVFKYYDYLPDGDVREKTERWAYSNYSLNFQ